MAVRNQTSAKMAWLLDLWRNLTRADPSAIPVSSPANPSDADLTSLTNDMNRREIEPLIQPHHMSDLLSYDGEEFIQRCYFVILRRAPDADGLKTHLDSLRSGISKQRIANEFAESEEAAQLRQSDVASRAMSVEAEIDKLLAIDDLTADARERLLNIRAILAGSTVASSQPNLPGVTPPQPTAKNVVVIKSSSERELSGPAGSVREEPTSWTLWVDLTTTLEWKSGVVGIIRAELEIARGLKRLHPDVRFVMQIEGGFAEVEDSELRWLLDSDNVVDAYMSFFGRYPNRTAEAKSVHVTIPTNSSFFHPFNNGDVIFSAGWMDSRKEEYFSFAKKSVTSLDICYVVYDMILVLDQTSHFYDHRHSERFLNYIEWISMNVSFILFGGETAKRDTIRLQQAHGFPEPPGQAVKFGADLMNVVDVDAEPRLLAEVGVRGRFIIAVGSIEPRKNYETLYRAYLLALETDADALPQLVICGRAVSRVGDLLDTLDRDPRLAGKLLHVAPTDAQLAALYKNCLFTILPSVYEGWSLTLPESLSNGKLCIAADTPPLREIGGDLIEYVAPFDVRSWADRILANATDETLRRGREERIRKEWHLTRWQDTAAQILDALVGFKQDHPPVIAPTTLRADQSRRPTVWMDLTLTFLQWSGHVTGVIRAELTFAYWLKKIAPETRFFAYVQGPSPCFFEIHESYLLWLFDANDLSTAYKSFLDFWTSREADGTGFRNPFQQNGAPLPTHPAYLPRFPDNGIVFFAGIDMDGTGEVSRCKRVLDLVRPNSAVMTSQLIYDLTPILFPHLHHEWTCVGYKPFVRFVSEHFDHLVFGGRTARRDGERVQRQNGWPSPPSDFIEFGSDLYLTGSAPESSPEAMPDPEVLAALGITGNFVMTVGTFEPRKNHEVLYKAYLHILERNKLDRPLQMVIVGKQGWKSDDLLATINADSRVKGKLLIISPNDEQLVALYNNCMFTLLPSFYEGWSLTLPESLNYGRFCLVSDVDPLREAGGDVVEYINPLDTFKWAERIEYYANNPAEVRSKEALIRAEWRARSWRESAEMLLLALYNLMLDTLRKPALCLRRMERLWLLCNWTKGKRLVVRPLDEVCHGSTTDLDDPWGGGSAGLRPWIVRSMVKISSMRRRPRGRSALCRAWRYRTACAARGSNTPPSMTGRACAGSRRTR